MAMSCDWVANEIQTIPLMVGNEVGEADIVLPIYGTVPVCVVLCVCVCVVLGFSCSAIVA